MWCPRCHTEVAAEIAQNGQSLLCTSCGTEIQRIYAPSLHPDTRSARELLERWSKADLTDVTAESPAVPSLSESMGSPAPAEAAPPELSPVVTLPVAASLVPPAPLISSTNTPTIAVEETPPADPVSGETTSGRRDRPERTKPDRQTPKPRTTWRVDAAHTVTQPAAPPPPPVPPRRPHFSALVGDETTGTTPSPSPPVEAKRPMTSRPAQPSANEHSEPVRSAHVERPKIEHVTGAGPENHRPMESPRAAVPQPTVAISSVQRRIDPAHESLGGPHFDLQAFLAQDKQKPGKSESTWGQVLAYAGVGLITVGTTLVLWGWFGQVAQYAPTGWLICTVGQMLLFLGVTTLISGGMQQTSHEVTRRVEYLGDRILRFEQSADQLLRGPHFSEIRERSKAKAAQTSQADSEELET